jgi:[NiFe] hydrogenase assembly HybE family chaperone
MNDASAIAARLEDAFQRVWRERMRDLSILNPALAVEAAGVRRWKERWLGALITPWSINLALLGEVGGGAARRVGEKRFHDFPVGRFEFISGFEESLGCFEMCSLFSPAVGFVDQAAARAAALAALDALFLTPEALDAAGSGEVKQDGKIELPGIAASAPGSDKVPSAQLSRRDLLRGVFRREGRGAP